MILQIKAFPLPFINNPQLKDQSFWLGSPSGNFCSASAYALALDFPLNNPRYQWIWKLPALPKVRFLIWIMVHNRIPTSLSLNLKGIEVSIICPRCKLDVETSIHVFRDCSQIQNLWDNLKPPLMDQANVDLSFQDWVIFNCKAKTDSGILGIPWNCAFPMILWCIWNSRNIILHGENNHWNSRDPLTDARERVELWAAIHDPKKGDEKSWHHISWEKPPPLWIKLNTDGAAEGNPGNAAAGGVFRDECGQWLLGFNRHIGLTTSVAAEIWAIRDGLSLAIENAFPRIILQSDSAIAIKLITDSQIASNHILFNLISDCRHLTEQIPELRFEHVFREGNGVANCLAKLGLKAALGFHVLQNIPPPCNLLLFADAFEVTQPRFCNG